MHDHPTRDSHESTYSGVNSSGNITHPSSGRAHVLEWQNVSLNFEGKQVLHNISCWVEEGELTCLCGANGAGKTQLVRLGLGLIAPTVGKVFLFGQNPSKSRHLLGYVPQLKAFNRNFPATVEDVLIAAMRGSWPLFSRDRERARAAECLQRVGGLTLLDKDMSSLSGGELQRVFMARALLLNPKMLILDEPLAAIDTKGRGQMMDLLEVIRAEAKVSVLLITHSEPVVRRLADRVIFVEKGCLVGWGETSAMLAIDDLRDVAFFGHDHESVIHGEEG
jgi:zinc transport system ATP-binding protein